jgi:hypothetical protein
LCKEYTTEKLFFLFQEDFNIIPVVRGAPDTFDIVPSNTYISTSDVNTPKSLARLCKLQKGCTRFAAASDKNYQLLAHGRWFSPATLASLHSS